MRPASACKACRERKLKCSVQSKSQACQFCQAQNLECSLSPRDRVLARQEHRSKRILAAQPQSPIQSPKNDRHQGSNTAQLFQGAAKLNLKLPPIEVCNEIVDLYFQILHDKQHSLFHYPTFIRAQREGTVPPIIILAIITYTARFSNHSYFKGVERRYRGQEWSRAVKTMLNIQDMEVSITTMQACHLIGSLAISEGDSRMESMCSTIANRTAQLLGLPHRLSSDKLERELELRVWWSIYMFDVWSASSRGLPRTFTLDPTWEWPMDEVAFNQLTYGTAAHSHEDFDEDLGLRGIHPRKLSMWGQMIPLTDIKSDVFTLNEWTASQNHLTIDENRLLRSVAEISSKLAVWLHDLPPRLHNTPENLAYFVDLGFGTTFLALHVGYHYHSMLLYYQFLHEAESSGPSECLLSSSPYARDYAERCKFHATSISDILWTGSQTPRCECLWMLCGHMLVISSSVHLHTLLLGDDEELINQARNYLERNFELLLRLQSYWPGIFLSTTRLRVFHKACLRAARLNDTFRMDRWLLNMLQEHHEAIVNESTNDDQVDVTGDSLSAANMSAHSPSSTEFRSEMYSWIR
ncbi:hypothetical protein BP5796_05695 [Coleophoma crateriformis]|uniref:Zn(2)-C6 fungal-type domain-containing protein n=1 Tax=Coleophoma crateriformis TaxID=565419 RepID=A0A3D8RUW4_9HELO|nr:hypothetical protein BP5796_05695 [Coleophoma crateriformis]